jgi:hypothetical protein
LIGDPRTFQVTVLFDALYMLMVRLLQYVFDSATSNDHDELRPYAQATLQLMTTVIKPLGEALALMPAGTAYGEATAGPTFGIGRTIPLPLTPALAHTIATERLAELQNRLSTLAATNGAPQQLKHAAASLERIALSAPPD